ncbi:hypothetical protein SeLEV6574_g07061 [Synchytrium endobioticum]|uniref:Poly(A)-specific ribonuclease RNA-binding domain-containing protein n=1 Tax=Synchytrium endobioticum TaxID=286115 RepID=A0A507CLV2_9FUNG|nr:hypothetical protein SeLEV6574_g07061 [Synchytrium endobioticum]
MQVLKSTFSAVLPTIQDAIKQADFIAVDTELTGLSAGASTNYSSLDTPQERYSKLRQSSQKFTITQYGVCCFIWDSQSASYISRPFNFYIFPASAKFPFNVYERNFMCQVGSLEFLAKNGFDFNAWIRHGIPYCSNESETYIRTQITGQTNSDNDIVVDDANKDFVHSSLNQIHEWLQSSTDKTIHVETPTSYHRKLLVQQVRKKYPSLAVDPQERNVQVMRLTDEERQEGLGDPTLQLEKALDEYIGFRKVMDMISNSGKPLIGHNMLLDLIHTYNCFIGALPEKWEDFKTNLNKAFATIYDTKHVCKSIPELATHFPESSLETVFTTVNQDPFTAPTIRTHPDHSRYEGDNASYHEAGWDAHATGVAFARLVAHFQGQTVSHPRVAFDDDRVMELLNRLNIMKSDIAYLHLSGDDDQPDRTSILHIYDIPKEWKNRDIELLFNSTDHGAITLLWINSTSSFIKFEDSTKSEGALAHYLAKHGKGNQSNSDDAGLTTYKLQRYSEMVRPMSPTRFGNGGTNGDSGVRMKRSASNTADSWYYQCIIS